MNTSPKLPTTTIAPHTGFRDASDGKPVELRYWCFLTPIVAEALSAHRGEVIDDPAVVDAMRAAWTGHPDDGPSEKRTVLVAINVI